MREYDITEEQLMYIIANEDCDITLLSRRTGLTPDQIHEAYKGVFDRRLYPELSEKARNYSFTHYYGGQDTFGERLAMLLYERGHTMSVDEVAKKIGITKNTLYAQLDDGRKPHMATAEKIADYFGVSTEWLLAGMNEGQE